MFKKGDLVETRHYLRRGPIEIGANTLFKVQEVSKEEGEEYVFCEPMASLTRTKSSADDIEYCPIPIAIEDLQYHLRGPKGRLLSGILAVTRTSFASGQELRIPLDDLIRVIDKEFNPIDRSTKERV